MLWCLSCKRWQNSLWRNIHGLTKHLKQIGDRLIWITAVIWNVADVQSGIKTINLQNVHFLTQRSFMWPEVIMLQDAAVAVWGHWARSERCADHGPRTNILITALGADALLNSRCRHWGDNGATFRNDTRSHPGSSSGKHKFQLVLEAFWFFQCLQLSFVQLYRRTSWSWEIVLRKELQLPPVDTRAWEHSINMTWRKYKLFIYIMIWISFVNVALNGSCGRC